MTELSSEQEQKLVDAAREARGRAYAPYSKFFVGAAVLSADGTIVCGANVENASFGATLCAERAAIAAMLSAGHQSLLAVAVYTEADVPTTPCGICRQVIAEFGPRAIVICATPSAVQTFTAAQLLPAAFALKPSS